MAAPTATQPPETPPPKLSPEELEFDALVKQCYEWCSSTKRTLDQLEPVLITCLEMVRRSGEIAHIYDLQRAGYVAARIAEKLRLADKVEATPPAPPPRLRPDFAPEPAVRDTMKVAIKR